MHFFRLPPRLLGATALAAGLLTFTACEKDEASASDDSAAAQSAALRMAQASAAFSTAYDQSRGQASQQGDLHGLKGQSPGGQVAGRTCGTATFATTPGTFWPVTMRIAYGPDCRRETGHDLSGTIVATFDGLLHAKGTSIAFDFEGFTVDGVGIDGRYQVTNLGNDAEGRQQARHQITQGTVTYPDGSSFVYDETTVSTLVAGQATNFFNAGMAGVWDDVWDDSREATLVNSRGESYSLSTDVALRQPVTCDYETSGRLSLVGTTLSGAAKLDFGDGACDNKAVLIYAGIEYAVEL